LLYRAPIRLYGLRLGWLLGSRFVLLTHVGRRSGLPRHVVLEAIAFDRASGACLVASGYGMRADWLRNVLARPRVSYQVGRRRYAGSALPLPPAESGRALSEYAARRPRAARAMMRVIGQETDGSAESYARIGSDREHGVPLVSLRPDR
jgi:deazaflavin-dependent oxidoreductase (nitroreductase family)